MSDPMTRVTVQRSVALAVATLLLVGCGTKADPGANSDFGGSPDARADGRARRDGGGPASSEAGALGSGDAQGADGACAVVKKQAEHLPVDLVFAIDTSFSMDFDDKWTNLSAALEAFVWDPGSTGLDIGLQFFPLRETCVVSAYEDLAVPLAPRANVTTLVETAITGKRMAGGTPTVQVLQGLVAYLRANSTPGFKPVIVLATDGVPDSTCLYVPDGGTPNSLANAEAVASQAFLGSPSIPVFVIGVGSDLTALNALADAGGTGSATLVAVGPDAGDPEQEFLDALDRIRLETVPCEFSIPTGTSVDPDETNVDYTSGGGVTRTFVCVGDAPSCSQALDDGWYFDDATDPTEVILCSGACAVVKADPGAQIDVALGCPRINLK
jgi:hypothetical protein